MSKYKDAGKQIGEALSLIDFSVSQRNHIALVKLPAMLFAEYVPDGNREYQRGEVVRVGHAKYLMQNFGKIDPNNPPPTNNLCKLFRDSASHDADGTPREWVREEFCLQCFQRLYNGAWYEVTSAMVDSATPPPNDGQNWKAVA